NVTWLQSKLAFFSSSGFDLTFAFGGKVGLLSRTGIPAALPSCAAASAQVAFSTFSETAGFAAWEERTSGPAIMPPCAARHGIALTAHKATASSSQTRPSGEVVIREALLPSSRSAGRRAAPRDAGTEERRA